MIIGDVELELEQILLEKSDIQEMLSKMESICINHEEDKARLHDEIKKVSYSPLFKLLIKILLKIKKN